MLTLAAPPPPLRQHYHVSSYIEAVKEAALPISRIAKKKSGKWICECGKDLGSDPTRWTTVHVQQHEGSKDHT